MFKMVRKTKQVGFEPVFESLHSWSIIGVNSTANAVTISLKLTETIMARIKGEGGGAGGGVLRLSTRTNIFEGPELCVCEVRKRAVCGVQ